MNSSDLDKTVQQVQRLSEETQPSPASPQSIQHAQVFIEHVYAAETKSPWIAPTVEAGDDGVVVFLWQDGQHYLSLVVGPEGMGQWRYDPGYGLGGITTLDTTSRLIEGACTPESFVREIWLPWSRGEYPGTAR